MACITGALWDLCTQGNNTGGIDEIKVLSGDELGTVTVDSNTGAITAITLDQAATIGFQKVDFQTEGADNTTEFVITNGTNVISTNTTNFTTPKEDAVKYKFIEELLGCVCGVVIYYKDLNGEEWLIGTEGEKQRAYATTITGVSGRSFEDENKIDWVFVARGSFSKRNMTGVALPTV